MKICWVHSLFFDFMELNWFVQVMLKMKSRHVAGTITKKKKSKGFFGSCFLKQFLKTIF